ncbi:Ubiquitin [Aphelenchoides besseyi]|nr:Ubiquitin [Aphelenchoides besseyi]
MHLQNKFAYELCQLEIDFQSEHRELSAVIMGNSQEKQSPVDKPASEAGEQPSKSPTPNEQARPPRESRPPVQSGFRLTKPLVYDYQRQNPQQQPPVNSPGTKSEENKHRRPLPPSIFEDEEDHEGGVYSHSEASTNRASPQTSAPVTPNPANKPQTFNGESKSERSSARVLIIAPLQSPHRATARDVEEAKKRLKERHRERLAARRANTLRITIDSVVSGFNPREIALPGDATVQMLKQKVRGRARVNRLTLSFNGKELSPDNSTLESHGVISGATVRVHVRSQTGTNNTEDVAALLDLSRSLGALRDLINALPLPQQNAEDREDIGSLASRPKHVPTVSAEDKVKRMGENRKTRNQMSKLREKIGFRSASDSHVTSTRSTARRTSSLFSLGSDESSTAITDKLPMNQGPMTVEEAALYYDPAENEEFARRRGKDLFDPPETQEQLEQLREQLHSTRCAFCRAKLPLALRVQPCRCAKIYCRDHRAPEKHCCPVDLKRVGRAKLEAEVASKPRTPANNDRDDLADTPRKAPH